MSDAAHASDRPITILICALGGEGGGVLSEWLVEAALQAGYPVQSTSIPGVAQRTGATTYYVEIFPIPQRELGGAPAGVQPVPGARRARRAGLVGAARDGAPDRQRPRLARADAGHHVAGAHADDERADAARRRPAWRASRCSRSCAATAASTTSSTWARVTREAGTVVSAVMFGALAASGALPFGAGAVRGGDPRRRQGRRSQPARLRRGACDRRREARARVEFVQRVVADGARARRRPRPWRSPGAADLAAGPRRALSGRRARPLALGHARVHEYQDAAYADALRRAAVARRRGRAGERSGAARAAVRSPARRRATSRSGWRSTTSCGSPTSSAGRRGASASVARSRSRDGELLRVYDHFKPGVPEVAALLPATARARR